MAIAAAVLALPVQAVSADSEAVASVKLPPSKYMGDCAGKVPVVVASDSAAQSDIYSAVTLAGALGTDCVVLAGPRHTSVPSDQAARLAAANSGGYVVGGAAAVPDWKVSGRTWVRISGADRWATAELVGDEAKNVGAGSPSTPSVILGDQPEEDPEPAPDSASRLKLPPSKYLGDCSGDVPVVVASDAAAQSDIYSAVTLAGALGTDCVVVAGERGEEMSSEQTARLDAANAGGYVVGGTAAVPDSKVSGRTMVRISGADRWATAEQVGAEAELVGAGASARYKSVATGTSNTCAVKTDGTLTCWGANSVGQAEPPTGFFKTVDTFNGIFDAAGRTHSVCAIRVDDTLSCWFSGGALDVPDGRFKAVAVGFGGQCAIRYDDTLACWVHGSVDAPTGRFKAISAGGTYFCGIRADDTLTCWGRSSFLVGSPPAGRFKAVASAFINTCAIGADDTLTCWGSNAYGLKEPPAGSFKAVAAGNRHVCAIKTDDTLACWGEDRFDKTVAPAGSFKAVSAGGHHTCAIRTNDTLVCWGDNSQGQTDVPS